MASITEDGRILDTSPMSEGKGILEWVDGRWIPARSPLYGDDVMNARVLSEEELSQIINQQET